MTILPISTPVGLAPLGEVAESRLRESPYFFLKGLHCHFKSGVLTIRGRVPNQRLKQFAETIVARIDGVEEIDNRIEVFDPMRDSITVRAARNAG
jgi:osmotically-inducible protein OsmY